MVTNNSNAFNPAHCLVSEHHAMTEAETAEVLQRLGIEKDKLPKIKIDDPAVQYLIEIHNKKGDIQVVEGSVIKVIRTSTTAGEFETYRLVIKG